jgi:hypothetical protein
MVTLVEVPHQKIKRPRATVNFDEVNDFVAVAIAHGP